MMKNSRITIIIAIITLVTGAIWYLFLRTKPVKTAEEALDAISSTPQVQVETNPVKKVPSLNPVEKTNPFKIPNPF